MLYTGAHPGGRPLLTACQPSSLDPMEVFQLLMPIFTEYGYLAVFVMLLICGFGVPVPEDVTLVTGGVIAGLGHADVHTMFAVGMAGVLIGDGLMFTLGRLYGQRIQLLPGFRKILTPQRFALSLIHI